MTAVAHLTSPHAPSTEIQFTENIVPVRCFRSVLTTSSSSPAFNQSYIHLKLQTLPLFIFSPKASVFLLGGHSADDLFFSSNLALPTHSVRDFLLHHHLLPGWHVLFFFISFNFAWDLPLGLVCLEATWLWTKGRLTSESTLQYREDATGESNHHRGKCS